MTDYSKFILDAVRAFLSSCPDNYDYPIGGEVAIPAKVEQELLAVLDCNVSRDVLEDVRQIISRDDAYELVIFAVRMAIYAARARDAVIIEKSLWMLCVDDNEVDWRDALVALAIIEDCSVRIGFDFRTKMEQLVRFAQNRRRRTIESGYLSRTSEMRDVETLGYKPIHSDGKELSYVRCF